VLAAQFGYLPSTLWIVIGAVLGGCVQDFVILGYSLKRDGRSLGKMARDEIGPVGGLVALAGVLLARGLQRRRLPAAAERLLAALQHRLPEETSLAIARARLLEWSLHKPVAAHEVVSAALQTIPAGSPHLADLERRRARLEQRLARSAGRTARPSQSELFPNW